MSRADAIQRPAERLAAQLAHAGNKHGAEVVNALLRSHRAQRQQLIEAHRQRQPS